MGSFRRRRGGVHHRIGPTHATMLLVSFILSAAPATLAFQTSRPLPTGGSAMINTKTQQLILQSSRRISSYSSSTSLHLNFPWNKNDEEATKTPEPVEEDETDDRNVIQKYLPTAIKVVFPSFLAGGVVTLGVLFLPLLSDYYDAFSGSSYNDNGSSSSSKTANSNNNNNANMNNVNQPVILFESILNDLNDAYVDDVDVQKLFETGVRAMTASLDPYTEFESRSEAQELEESVSGKYGGVGLVIRGGMNLADASEDEIDINNVEKIESSTKPSSPPKPSSKDSKSPPVAVKDAAGSFSPVNWLEMNKLEKKQATGGATSTDDADNEEKLELAERRRARRKSMEDGIRVVSAFEGYAYDAGMRVGDKLLAVDDFEIKPTTSVEEVRNHLRGDPGTPVSISFLREGVGGKVNEPQTIELKRAVVHIPDVKYFGFIGDPKDGIGYIDLEGFANDAGREVRFAIRALQHGAQMIAAKNGGGADSSDGSSIMKSDPSYLKGLVLDLRGNPGGLLTSAVDVATLFVPNGSDIVSAKGRGFPETLYRSQTEPVLNPNTRLTVLVNEQTASAAEIVTGAVQDLDVGVVVGKGRTFGKGLVQNVQDLPYQTALKYTVAKYYTPSGRCIQSTVYEEGSSSDGENGGAKFKSKKVLDKDRNVFYTAHGREVKDGGGVEVDYKIEPQKASPLEIILLNTGTYADYAAEWSKTNQLTDNFKVDDALYKDFQRFVEKRQRDGDVKLEVLYDSQLKELQKKLKVSKLASSSSSLEKLRSDIVNDVKRDFSTYKTEIMEDLSQNILARYLPDSMLIERGLRKDSQVAEAATLIKDGKQFDKILARDGSLDEKRNSLQKTAGQQYETTSTMKPSPLSLQTSW